MTEEYFFDTDCISAFLWIKNESILEKLYPGRIVLPMQVYEEIKKVPPLLQRVETMKGRGSLMIESIMADSEEYKQYCSMAISPASGQKLIGKGEAACIALAKKYDGVLSSNNLRDIMPFVDKYKLKHITTGDILVEALRQGIITESEGNVMWGNMLLKKRMLPTSSFSEYINRFVES